LEKIEGGEFSIDQVYGFSGHLKSLHPQNNFVREKIRQQLQILRDRGLLRFKSRGKYELVAV
jgi:type II restriction enzyme